jgi:hypothetical protein
MTWREHIPLYLFKKAERLGWKTLPLACFTDEFVKCPNRTDIMRYRYG